METLTYPTAAIVAMFTALIGQKVAVTYIAGSTDMFGAVPRYHLRDGEVTGVDHHMERVYVELDGRPLLLVGSDHPVGSGTWFRVDKD